MGEQAYENHPDSADESEIYIFTMNRYLDIKKTTLQFFQISKLCIQSLSWNLQLIILLSVIKY